jgi:hypothetical protein
LGIALSVSACSQPVSRRIWTRHWSPGGRFLEAKTSDDTNGDVILLIKPTQSQPYEAKLFIRDDWQLREVPQATYFAFDRRASSLLRPSSAEPLVKGEPTARTETPFSGIEQQLGIPLGILNFSFPAMTVRPVRLRRQHLSSTMDPKLLLLAGRLLGNLKSLFQLRPMNANLNTLLPLSQPPKMASQRHRFRVKPNPFVSQTLHCYPAKRQSLGLSSSPLGRSPVGGSSRNSRRKNGRVAS